GALSASARKRLRDIAATQHGAAAERADHPVSQQTTNASAEQLLIEASPALGAGLDAGAHPERADMALAGGAGHGTPAREATRSRAAAHPPAAAIEPDAGSFAARALRAGPQCNGGRRW